MSRAFVKEPDADTPADLPDLPVSAHPNYVTAAGLAQLEDRLVQAERQLATLGQADGERLARAHVERNLRWLRARIASAILVPAPVSVHAVAFGSCVRASDDTGRNHSYRIVGEDQADPQRGLVSWISPLARALHGARVGDTVTWTRPAGDLSLDVVAIEP